MEKPETNFSDLTIDRKSYSKPTLREFGGFRDVTRSSAATANTTLDYAQPSYFEEGAS